MTPPPILLHVGMHKTGTTSIQKFLAGNRTALLRSGILYPDLGHGDSHPGLALSLPNRRADMIRRMRRATGPGHQAAAVAWPHPDQAYGDLADTVAWYRPDLVALSSECFLEWLDPALVRDALARSLGGPVTVLIYLRNPEDWIESVYRQVVRDPEIRFAGDPAHLPQWDLLDYPALLRRWADVFGRDALRVRSYDTADTRARGVVGDVETLLRLPGDDARWYPPRDTNAALDHLRTEQLRRDNGGCADPAAVVISGRQRRRFRRMYRHLDRHWLPAGHRIDRPRGLHEHPPTRAEIHG